MHVFYYAWYGTPESDMEWKHWNHDILPHWSDTSWDNAGNFKGGDDIGANFYPEMGCYSSSETGTIEKHCQMLVRAGIGVMVISWWGKDSPDDAKMPQYLNIANRHHLQVSFHIEPFYNNAQELKTELDYLATTYGDHPGLYRVNQKPFYYLYDSYKLEVKEWQKILSENGEWSIRNTSSDATIIGLWVNEQDGKQLWKAHFDGCYTYFASDGFVYGSTTANWPEMAQFANEKNLLFIPCAGPGYLDTRIRPWNNVNSKERANGTYYKAMFNSALSCDPNYIGITSFNEWHEGTQIEPAVPHGYVGYIYQDYGSRENSWYYIDQSRAFSQEYYSKSMNRINGE